MFDVFRGPTIPSSQTPPMSQFRTYFQDELSYLRSLGRAFAEQHTELAPMLADRGADPDVDRLFEGAAFVMGRIRQKLDDEIPEVIHDVAAFVFPHLLRPIPSVSILEVSPLPSVLRDRFVVPAGTEFGTLEVEGTTCVFRTTTDTTLAPLAIENVQLEPTKGSKHQLRIDFAMTGGAPIQTVPDRLRLFATGPVGDAFSLLRYLHEQIEEVVVLEPAPPPGVWPRETSLGKSALEAVGYRPDEALFPMVDAGFSGFRLLEEFFLLPEKFAFLDIKGLGFLRETEVQSAKLSLGIRLKAGFKPKTRISKDTFKLHCVPVVNLFDVPAEHIRFSGAQKRFHLRPEGLSAQVAEVYAVRRCLAVLRGSAEPLEIPPFFDMVRGTKTFAGQEPVYYTTHATPSVIGEGADVFVAFGTPSRKGIQLDAHHVTVELTVTNGRLASGLRVGAISQHTEGSPPIATFRNVIPSTRYVPPLLGGEMLWKLLAHAGMTIKSFVDIDILRSLLTLHNFQCRVDTAIGKAHQKRMEAIKSVTVTPAEMVDRGANLRGINLEVEVDDSAFAGDGEIYMLGNVIHRLCATYLPFRSFCTTTLKGVGESDLRIWLPPERGTVTRL